MVGVHRDPGVERLRVDQLQRGLLRGIVGEEPPAAAEDDGEDHQPVLVDEIVLEERLHQGADGHAAAKPS